MTIFYRIRYRQYQLLFNCVLNEPNIKIMVFFNRDYMYSTGYQRLFIYLLTCLTLFNNALTAHDVNSFSHFHFERVSIEQGLSQVTVFCQFQDHRGFMWFGTMDGLNRYDGYEFKVFRQDPTDKHSISNNRIKAIYEDHKNILWVGTDEGLNSYDFDSGKFKIYKHNSGDSSSLSHDYINMIFEDHSGILWIGTNAGINIYDRENDRFIRFNPASEARLSIEHSTILVIYEDCDGEMWFGTTYGLYRYNPAKSTILHYYPGAENPYNFEQNTVSAIYEEDPGMLLLGTSKGLIFFSKQKERFVEFPSRQCLKTNEMMKGAISTIYGDRYGSIWIGTDKGLYLYDKRAKLCIEFLHNSDNPVSISDNNIVSISESQEGVIWIGTYGAGLNKFDPGKARFHTFQKETYNPNSISNNLIYAFWEDKSGTLWIGSDNGLNRYDRRRNVFTRYANKPEDLNSLSNNRIRALCEDDKGILWIGTYGGLNKFNKKTGEVERYNRDKSGKLTSLNTTIYHICPDQKGNLWLATPIGLAVFNKEKEQFNVYKHDPENPRSLGNNEVRIVYRDREGVLWIGTYGGGLNRYNQDENDFTIFRNDPADNSSLSSNFIYSIYEDTSGVLWIGTYGGGLDKFDPDRGVIAHYGLEEGLPNEVIYGILPGSDGELWLSTNKGLSRFNPPPIALNETIIQSSFRNYDSNDGLLSNEFNFGAYFKNKNGELYFGGTRGFIRFHPDSIQVNTTPPSVVITDFKVLNKQVEISKSSPLRKAITETNNLELSYKDYVLSFEFAALHYSNPQKNHYAYMLDGMDEDWVYTAADRRYATYTTLKGGTYTFKVKGSNSDGKWSDTSASILITIVPPFWETWWFRIITAALILFIIFGLYKIRMDQIKKRSSQLQDVNIALNKQIEERMKAEAALQISEEKFRSLTENINAGIYRSTPDPKGRFLEINPALIQMFGYNSKKELLTANVSDLFQNPDDRAAFNQKMQRDGFVKDAEILLRKKDGSPIWCSETAVAIYDKRGKIQYYDGLIEDITEKKHLEQQIRQAQKMEAIGSLAGGIAHDFNNLLTVINGHAELAINNIDKKHPLYKDMSEILKCGRRAGDLTQQLLAFSRKQPIVPKILDINTLIVNLEQMLKRLIGEDIEINTSLATGLPPIKADQGQLEQVFMNMIINARDAIHERGNRTIEKMIAIETSQVETDESNNQEYSDLQSGKYILIKISDTGKGIPEEVRNKIFEPFFTTKSKGKGTGLGLATVFGIIKQNRGTIAVESEPEKGTMFKIFWPVSDETGGRYPAEMREEENLAGKEKILLVEDDEGVRNLASIVLEKLGYKIYTSANGREAMTIIAKRKNHIDLLISDMVMPEMNGHELANEIIKIVPEIRILFTSGYTDERFKIDGISEDRINFLPKPYSPRTLAKTVREVLEAR